MNVDPTLMCVIALSVITWILAYAVSKADEKENRGGKKVKATVWIPTMTTVVVLFTAYMSTLH